MQPMAFFFFFPAGNLEVELEEQWRSKRQRDREVCNGGLFFFGETVGKKLERNVYFFVFFLGLEIGMEYNK